jgi:hypothetical protein
MKVILVFLICFSFFNYFSCYSIAPTTDENIDQNQSVNILSLLGQLTNGTSSTNAINHLSTLLNLTPSNLVTILNGVIRPQPKFNPIETVKTIFDFIASFILWSWILTIDFFQHIKQEICFFLEAHDLILDFCYKHKF